MEAGSWIIVQTKPGLERQVVERLRRQGFLALAPRIEKWIVMRGVRVLRNYAMFPSYVFVCLARLAWAAITGTVGVSRILTDRGVPSVIKPAVVGRIFSEVGFDLVKRAETSSENPTTFLPGQRVRADESSSLALFPGKFISMSGTDRCKVLFSMFGRQTVTEICTEQLVAA